MIEVALAIALSTTTIVADRDATLFEHPDGALASGSGPVDATFKAIESVAESGSELLLYSVNAITTGTDAQGEVTATAPVAVSREAFEAALAAFRGQIQQTPPAYSAIKR